MSSITVEDILSTLNQKKSGFRIRLCLRKEEVVTYTSSKAFYNHTHGSKACPMNHVVITRATLGKAMRDLEAEGFVKDGLLRCRKPRADRITKHNYPKNPKKRARASVPSTEPTVKIDFNDAEGTSDIMASPLLAPLPDFMPEPEIPEVDPEVQIQSLTDDLSLPYFEESFPGTPRFSLRLEEDFFSGDSTSVTASETLQ